jgi:hypothetical protein
MEGTRRGRESARKIFERGARSGQSNTRVHSEGRVQEEQAESESGKERCKVRRQNGWKGRVQDADGMVERKEKQQGEEREVLPEEQICQTISRKIKSKTKMELSERDKDMTSKKEGKESKNPDTTGRPRGYDRGNSGVPGERECKRKKNDGEI